MKCEKIKIPRKHLKLDLTFSEKYKKLFFSSKISYKIISNKHEN